ncbi:hypothetical protein L1987_64967 [Smallanthus sonchifolius]|uniref:Uncharacterized protein n=1 Tax=Smallanthus sonchifolius TaxID=185202 RepID=A0ACB9BT68_9ASTR|nr:hypothetical protein L1987_64967 [Smallanthus sonchifolius]
MDGKVYDTERVVGKSPPMLESISEFSNWKFTEHTIWESIVKGNATLQERRFDLLLKQFNMFSYKKNETLSEQVTRFSTMINRLRKMGVKFEEYDLGKKLLDSLPDCWSILYAKKRELNNQDKSNVSGSANAVLFSRNSDESSGSKSDKSKGCCEHSSGEKVKTTSQIPEDQIALFEAFLSSYDTLVTGKLQPAVHDVEDLVQINPDDFEYMDLQWKMAMIAVRAKKYLQKQLGHFAHECSKDKKKKVEGNGLKLVEMIEEDENSRKPPTALMSKQLTNCEWDDEIEDAEGEFDEALMAEIEVSKKTTEVVSDCALKTNDKGKHKAVADSNDISFESEVNSDNEFDICSSVCLDRMHNYHAANTFLILENDKLKRVNKELKKNEVTYTRKIKALLKDNVTFKEYLDKMNVLIKDLSEKTHCIGNRFNQRTDGLGYNKVPHPEPHKSNELINASDSNFHDMYVSANVNTSCVEDEVDLDGVKCFYAFNKQCTREFIRDCKKYLDVDCDLKRFVNVCEKFDDVNSHSYYNSSYVSACSTNIVCDDSDYVSEVSSTSTFFDKVVHTARDYVPLHKVSILPGDVVLDEYGNPLIREYDLPSERPKKNDFIAPENHILTSEQESKKFVKVKISAPTKAQRELICVKGKSVDVKDKFIYVKDKHAHSKGHLRKSVCVSNNDKEKSVFEVGECSKSRSKLKTKGYNCYVCGQVGHFTRNYKHNSSESKFNRNKDRVKNKITKHFKKASENDNVSESGVKQRYSRAYLLSRDCYNLYSNKLTGMTINNAWHVDSDMILMHAPTKFNTYVVDMNDHSTPVNVSCLLSKATGSESCLWNRRIGHDETPETIIEFIKWIENICDSKVSINHSDNGTEFKNKLINVFCAEKGITHQFSVARTRQQNGVAERKNRTLIEAARTMLVDSKLPIIFWAEAVNTACYILNRVLMVKQHTKTSYELFFKRKSYIKFFRAFGCSCTLFNTQDSLPKFAAVGDECYFLGYSSFQKAYIVYNKRTKNVQESYYVERQEMNISPEQNGHAWFFDADVIFKTFDQQLQADLDDASSSNTVIESLTRLDQAVENSMVDPQQVMVQNEASADITSSTQTQEEHLDNAVTNADSEVQEIPNTIDEPAVTKVQLDSSNEQTEDINQTSSSSVDDSNDQSPDLDVSNMPESVQVDDVPIHRIHSTHPVKTSLDLMRMELKQEVKLEILMFAYTLVSYHKKNPRMSQ